MINLKFDIRMAYESGMKLHPKDTMEILNINYVWGTYQSLGDCWWFWGCDCDINNLPIYLKVINIEPMECIGFGLSKEKAIELTKLIKP